MKWNNPSLEQNFDQSKFNQLLVKSNIPFLERILTQFLNRMFPKPTYKKKHLLDLAKFCSSIDKLHSAPDSLSGGYTYLGQFIDHDMSNVSGEKQQSHGDFGSLIHSHNRVKRPLTLSSIYGSDAEINKNPPGILVNGLFDLNTNQPINKNEPWDIPRFTDGKPKIADLRNDNHFLLAQMHCLFLRFHNVLVKNTSLNIAQVKEQVQFTYRNIVREDYLKTILYEDVWQEYFGSNIQRESDTTILLDKTFSLMPAPFHAAVFRFGHSIVRNRYEVTQKAGGIITLQDMFKYTHKLYLNNQVTKLPDFLVLDWEHFFANPANNAPRISPCVKLKVPNFPDELLAELNLLRGVDFELADAQTYLTIFKKSRPESAEIFSKFGFLEEYICLPDKEDKIFPHAEIFKKSTPLWYYTLIEAFYFATRKSQNEYINGRKNLLYGKKGLLGPLGSYILAEVFSKCLSEEVGQNHISLQLSTFIELTKYVKTFE